MPVFVPPSRQDWTFADGVPVYPDPSARRFWAHFGTQPRGRSVIKIDGTWTIVDNPTNAQITNATPIVDTNGERVPGALLGGHVTPVTDAVAAELTSAGLGAYLA